MAKARLPDSAAGVTVRSGISDICAWLCASPWPSSHTGGLGRVLAMSGLTTTTQPPPSVTRQQSRRCSGEAIMSDASTSSTLSGSRR